jgi:enterochelin esterase-like enzyme
MKNRLFFIFAFVFFFASISLVAQEAPVSIPTCPSEEVICRVVRSYRHADLQAKIGNLAEGEGNFYIEDEQLIFIYRLSNSRYNRVEAMLPVVLSATMANIAMQRVGNTDWWTLTLKFDDMDKVLMSVMVAESGSSGNSYHPVTTLRGINAPSLPPRNQVLQGSYAVHSFESASLGESRDIHLYLPPDYDDEQIYPVIYMADGQSLESYAPMIDYLISHGEIAPLIVVGIASADFQNNVNVRGEEYVHGRNPEHYAKHRIFFNEEVPEWAETYYSVSREREDRTVFGISNGGLYAVAMNLHYPERYGTVFAFSAGASLGFEPLAIKRENLELPLRVYGIAGTLEPIFHETTSDFIAAYSEAGADAVFFEQVAGHEGAMWEVELYNALRWRFATSTHEGIQ